MKIFEQLIQHFNVPTKLAKEVRKLKRFVATTIP